MAREYPNVYVQPPARSKAIAQAGLDAREMASKSNKCCLTTQDAGALGIGSGIARARDIIAGKRVNAVQVKSYFDRHQGYYEAAKRRAKKMGQPLEVAALHEKAIQGWWVWGGDPMRDAAAKAVERWRKDQESAASKLENPKWSCLEADTDLALLDAGPIDVGRVDRISHYIRQHGSWGALPPVRAFIAEVTYDDLSGQDHDDCRWTRPPMSAGEVYLHLIGGGKHRVIAACRAQVPLRFLLGFARSSVSVDDRAMIRRVLR